MIVIVILAIVRLSCAAVPLMRNNMMDPQIIAIGDVEGMMLYDAPDPLIDDPLVIQHQFSSMGAMPIFTLLESAKKIGNSKADISDKIKVAESKRVIDDAMTRLELAKGKLEKGNVNISTDIEKVIQSLKTLEKSVRPDIRQLLDSLQSIMTLANPMKEVKDFFTTDEPESSEKTGVLEKPRDFDKQALRIRIISDMNPKIVPKNALKNTSDNTHQSITEKSTEGEKKTEERAKPYESSEKAKEVSTKPPFEFKIKENKNTDDTAEYQNGLNIKAYKNQEKGFDGEDVKSSYNGKYTWKAAGIV